MKTFFRKICKLFGIVMQWVKMGIIFCFKFSLMISVFLIVSWGIGSILKSIFPEFNSTALELGSFFFFSVFLLTIFVLCVTQVFSESVKLWKKL